MVRKNGVLIKSLVIICILALLLSSLVVGFGATKSKYSFKITFMTQTFDADPAPPDSPVLLKLEDYTKVDVDVIWVPSTAYDDKLNIMLASGNLPMVLYANKTASIIGAARAGAFWELGPYLKNYKNLKKANPIVLWNSSIDGKIYGIYRARNLGRNGIVYRKDWLKNVGLDTPQTIDEFYKMLKAFTYNDPDKNGKADTYGMVQSKFMGPFNIMLTWFGGPNGWGLNANGQLVPAHLTNAYKECLKFWRQMYKERLFNADFAAVDPAKWEGMYSSGKGGVKVDVIDSANRIYQGLVNNGLVSKDAKDTDIVGIIQTVKGTNGQRKNLPTSGYAGMIMVTKTAVKDEGTLKKVLTFLDKLGDKQMQDLLGYGIVNRHYKLVNGQIDPYPTGSLSAEIAREIKGTNQMLMFIPPENATPRYQTPLIQLQNQMILANEKDSNLLVPNPAEALFAMSSTYIKRGATLDNIILDAQVKYISGQIDDKGFDKAIATWRRQGGDQFIKEVNELYRKFKKNIPYPESTYKVK